MWTVVCCRSQNNDWFMWWVLCCTSQNNDRFMWCVVCCRSQNNVVHVDSGLLQVLEQHGSCGQVSEQRPVHVDSGLLQVSEQHGSCGQWSVTGLRTTTGSCGGCCVAGLRTTWGARSTTHSAPSSRRPTPPGCTSWRDPHSSPWSVHSHRPATHIPSSRYWPAHPNGRSGGRPLVAAWSLSAGSKPGLVHFNSACPRCHVFNHTSSLAFRHIPPRGKMCLEFGFSVRMHME